MVEPAVDGPTNKFIEWLARIEEAVDRGETYNVGHGLAHLTATGTVLGDRRLVYVAEFLEWIVSNLRPGLEMKKDSFERIECSKILHEALNAAMEALRNRANVVQLHEKLEEIRYRATHLQLSRLNEAFHHSSLAAITHRLEEFEG